MQLGYEVKDLDKNKVLKQQLFKVQAKTEILVKAIGNNLSETLSLTNALYKRCDTSSNK